MTNDAGKNWVFSKLVPDLGLSQPTLVEFPGGAITAFFRHARASGATTILNPAPARAVVAWRVRRFAGCAPSGRRLNSWGMAPGKLQGCV